MKHTSTAAPMRTQKLAALAAVLGAITIGLTACGGGSSADGTYYIQDVNGTRDLGQLVIDGDSVTHHEYDCDGVYEEPDVTSIGEINENGDQIVWTVAGDDPRNDRTGTEAIVISETSISIGSDDVYVLDESEAGEQLLEGFEADCAS